MPSFTLSLQFTIKGIGAASGIVILGSRVFLVSDSSNRLYQYNMSDQKLEMIELTEDVSSENIPKRFKPDFESLTYHDKKLYIFGSGSTDKRNALVIVNPETKAVEKHDIAKLYGKMKKIADIDYDDFNIEGAFFKEHWYLFQRGNGQAQRNGIFHITGDLSGKQAIVYQSFPLVKCNGIPATFTDAILVGDKIWFLATAEDSQSVFHDGEILGTVVGRIDIKTMAVEMTEKISDKTKFEGIAFSSENEKEISFLLCEDNDTDSLESDIYKLTIKK